MAMTWMPRVESRIKRDRMAEAVEDQTKLINLGKAEKKGADERGAFAAALFEDGLQERSLQGFDPGSNCLTHVTAQCANSSPAGQQLKR